MRILIAEDEPIPRLLLAKALAEWGYEVVTAQDGDQAWQALSAPDAPRMAVLDWMMPGVHGPELCRRLRERPTVEPTYIILLTSRDDRGDVVAGLEAGASDYVIKPFDRDELRARIQVGRTIVELQGTLAARVRELEAALAQVRQLQGLLPICSYCKKVRDDKNYWQRVEGYLADHTEVQFSHGICPDCWRDVVGPQLRAAGVAAKAPGVEK